MMEVKPFEGSEQEISVVGLVAAVTRVSMWLWMGEGICR